MKNCLRNICTDVRLIENELSCLKEYCKRRDEERKAVDKNIMEMMKILCQIEPEKQVMASNEEFPNVKIEIKRWE